VGKIELDMSAEPGQEEYWRQTAREYGAALERLAWTYEADPDRRRDLLQEIHLALWRSFENFDARCSLRTWVYRVAHNAAISRVIRRRRNEPVFVTLEDIAAQPSPLNIEKTADRQKALARLLVLVRQLGISGSPTDSGVSGRSGRGNNEPDYGALRGKRLDQNSSD
jgi:DNA-directed RNA polymerase specialized sigma24 family protein